MAQAASRWRDLIQEAFGILDRVNKDFDIVDSWSFGGGTAMMIQIDHRESHDVDLFLDDPQLLPYVEAAVAEMPFALGEATYNGDGSGHLKIAFDGIGEIDFIVTGQITDAPTIDRDIKGRTVALETVPEIIAKKVRYRGSHVQPRDIFDIAAAVEAGQSDDILAALAIIPDYASATAARIESLSEDYVSSNISQLVLRETSKSLINTAYGIALDLLRKV
ncbi:nucleotidyl transferase AbiEii/AbiGii toxin family protein [Cognatiyoonia sp. IB215182]|uniref:nucleotidyl transferase AbiEii/AbiGii toxin family protein n=1 Tax=Cognatiyoonia sp. IB215182 TaxID=3097353 RepID=UPI002A15FBB4|nr:nucleotidyl transferase AbiEii/AbiGii toxin family protein [Cognatiyoonia sp. IB215182]MDX8355644.1 nucleotidyl transferase AbiEii/AbiGii toxin family protein [Cognatiyoonia sp. IB215182]